MDDAQSRRADDAPIHTSKHQDASSILATDHGSDVIGRTVTIARPRDELYAYWRDFSNLPHFMDNVVRVDLLDEGRSHWVVKAPGGTVEWDSEIVDEQDGAYIEWTSVAGADVPNSGRIEFRDAPGGRGTFVTAIISYDPPAGMIGKLIAKMFQREPAIQARRDLRRFKQLIETGEIATAARNRREYEEETA